jgi:peptidoglycan/xylan/chitin deacetylase (PgdA/CDA1 family)
LRELGLPATVFLTTGPIGTSTRLWHDRVFEAFHTTSQETLAGVNSEGETLDLRSDRSRTRARDRTLARLKSLEVPDRDALLDSILRQLSPRPSDRSKDRLMLSWDEVREMHASGVAFGAHTVSHPILTKLPLDRAVEEIRLSKQAIEQQLHQPVTGFAYPNGGLDDFDDRIRAAVRDCGFEYAVTTLFGSNQGRPGRGRVDAMSLRRIQPGEVEPAVFVAKLAYYDFANLNAFEGG